MTKFLAKAQARALARIAAIRQNEEGATAVEYGLMVALIAVVIIVAVTLVGTNLDAIFDAIAAALGGAGGGGAA